MPVIDKHAFDFLFDKIAKLKTEPFTQDNMQKMGDKVVTEMKDMISKGISPIKGNDRFPGYLHAGVKGKYPQNKQKKFPEKRDRPVNLYLSGAQMEALEAQAGNPTVGGELIVGYFDDLNAAKETGHREGVKGQPTRPTIPITGEEFAESIQEIIVDEAVKAIEDAID